MTDSINTLRKSALAEAQSLGIDTSGMSTREAKSAIKDTREAQSEMADFINKVLDARPPAQAAAAVAPAVAETRTVEDPASTFPRGGGGNGGSGNKGLPVEFYTWVDGQLGTVTVLCQSAPSPV